MRFIARIIGLFIRPNETIKGIVKDPRVIEALAIVVAYAILMVVYNGLLMARTNVIFNVPGLESANMPDKGLMLLFSSLAWFIMVMTAWAITAGALHLFSKAFGGCGTFIPNMMTAIGYTDLAKIPAVIVAILLVALTSPTTIMVSQSTTNIDIVTSNNQPLITIAGIVIDVGIILSSLLGIICIKHGEGLSLWQASIVVGVPLLVLFVFTSGYYILNMIARV